MTDKQIIIDGVDVSGCDFYDKNKKYCLTLKMDTRGFKNPSCFNGDFQKCIQDSKVCPNTFCDNNPNCYYKQLKRKEQECESLGHTYLETNELLQDKTKALTNLKSENDVLKTMLKDLSYENQKFCYQIEEQTKQLEPFKDEYFKGLDNVSIAKLAKKSIRITAENSKLEQTLIEIKEICNSVENIENINSLYDAKLSGMYLQANKILQKISECEVKNENIRNL